MLSLYKGSIRLFRIGGIDVFMHWSWIIVAVFQVTYRQTVIQGYESLAWNIAEYLSLFLIVLLHEFGHAFACRQVGGVANRIVLWPLGGVAYVEPPPRPGAVLWSIAAGPLVNVLLLPITIGLVIGTFLLGWHHMFPNLFLYLLSLAILNALLLGFNILPVYPLDGGQIVYALLWYVIGRVRALMVTSVLGLIGGVALAAVLGYAWDWWFAILGAFLVWRSWIAFRISRIMSQLENAPRRSGWACPSCKTAPVVGPWWICGKCRTHFDTFASEAVCPTCGDRDTEIMCPACLSKHQFETWHDPKPISAFDSQIPEEEKNEA